MNKPRPNVHRMIFQWHITNRCSLRCTHCYQETRDGKEPSLAELVKTLSQFEALLASKQETSGAQWRGHLTITGGDPFMHPDFLRLLGRIAAKRPSFTFAVLTNGLMIDDAVAAEFKRLKPAFVQLSLEGGRETHDGMRGRGNFEQTLTAVKRLVRHRIPTFISFTAHGGNFREFSEVADLGRQMGAARVWADRMIPCGQGAHMAGLVLSPEETREFFEIMHAAKQKNGRHHGFRGGPSTDIAMHRALQFLVGGGAAYRCTAGDTLLTVMPDGTLFPCRRLPVRVGNLFDTPLTELYAHSPLLNDLRDPTVISFGCEACRHAHKCRGGLKCLSHAAANDPFIADPGCWIANRKSAFSQLDVQHYAGSRPSAEAEVCYGG